MTEPLDHPDNNAEDNAPDRSNLGPMELLLRLDRDLRKASQLLGRKEVLGLTKLYYQIQEFRKAAANQKRSAGAREPNQVVAWVHKNMKILEDDIKRAMDSFTDAYQVGRWLKSICGIGPVLSAGFMAHLDIRKAKTAGHFLRYAGVVDSKFMIWKSAADCLKWIKEQGMTPTADDVLLAAKHWGRDSNTLLRFASTNPDGSPKRLTQDSLAKALARQPWNADLKLLCFKASDCFMKFQNHKKDCYGKYYVRRKEYEQGKNEAGDYKDQAVKALTEKNYGKDTEARKWYEQGKLPPGHIHMRCLRYTSTLFLSHLHHAMYVDYYQQEPPVPYIFVHGQQADHRHYIPPPNWPCVEEGRSLRELLVD